MLLTRQTLPKTIPDIAALDDLLCRRCLVPNRRYGGENVVPPIECVGADHHG